MNKMIWYDEHKDGDDMNILIVCNNGCSSSVLVKRLNNELMASGLSKKHHIDHAQFMFMYQQKQSYDIIMLCPQTYHEWLMMKKDDMKDIPIYMIPPKLFVSFDIEKMLEDGEDAIHQFKSDHKNPVFFPGEEAYMKNRRSVSYRKFKENKKNI